MEFRHTDGSPNLGLTTWPYNTQKKKRSRKIVEFAVSVVQGIKLEENEKKDKYLNFPREVKKKSNMKMTIVTIVIVTVTHGLLKGQEELEKRGGVQTIRITNSLCTARILRKVLETWWDLLSLKNLWKIIS